MGWIELREQSGLCQQGKHAWDEPESDDTYCTTCGIPKKFVAYLDYLEGRLEVADVKPKYRQRLEKLITELESLDSPVSEGALQELVEFLKETLQINNNLHAHLDYQQTTEMIESNIEWQRNWAQARLAELGIGVPSPMDAGSKEADAYFDQQLAKVKELKELKEQGTQLKTAVKLQALRCAYFHNQGVGFTLESRGKDGQLIWVRYLTGENRKLFTEEELK